MNVSNICRLSFRNLARFSVSKFNTHQCLNPKISIPRIPHVCAVSAKLPAGILQQRTASTETFDLKNQDGYGQSFAKKIRLYFRRYKLRTAGFKLYEEIADQIDYAAFMEKLDMPDTFYSWFIVTELHVWMVMVRLMANPYDGRAVRNYVVEALWKDVALRAKQLGTEHASIVRTQIYELNEGFQAALVLYDEGLLSNDKVLASALWRRFFNRNCLSAHHLETMIFYIRYSIRMLDSIEIEDLGSKKKINWLSIEKAIEEQQRRGIGVK